MEEAPHSRRNGPAFRGGARPRVRGGEGQYSGGHWQSDRWGGGGGGGNPNYYHNYQRQYNSYGGNGRGAGFRPSYEDDSTAYYYSNGHQAGLGRGGAGAMGSHPYPQQGGDRGGAGGRGGGGGMAARMNHRQMWRGRGGSQLGHHNDTGEMSYGAQDVVDGPRGRKEPRRRAQADVSSVDAGRRHPSVVDDSRQYIQAHETQYDGSRPVTFSSRRAKSHQRRGNGALLQTPTVPSPAPTPLLPTAAVPPPAAQLPTPADSLSQRERMSEQLRAGLYECLVCVEPVRQQAPVWTCSGCYQLLHLSCVRRWAKSSKTEAGGWRCPACQNVSSTMPAGYRCFCAKLRDPQWNRRDIPHSCGEVCGRRRADPECTHKCTLLCHPGPCPSCTASVRRSCPCGKRTSDVRCVQAGALTCDAVCDRSLNCGRHRCQLPCHRDPCPPCQLVVTRECFCGGERREEVCTEDVDPSAQFQCGAVCSRQLACTAHACQKLCHSEPCGPCPLDPQTVTRCPCGSRALSDISSQRRLRCSDPVPVCGSPCGRRLACGPPSQPHRCASVCHPGVCGPCELQTAVRCRCGHMDRQLACSQLTTRADDARCQKRCNKKRACGKHRCGQECCILLEHPCHMVCGRKLECGLHTCEEPCHPGQCPRCWRASFDELYCECGSNVTMPPVACGTRPPPCGQPCCRHHPCGHPVLHTCHSAPQCPPCTQLMRKLCYGGHEERGSVPCHQTAVSCGRPCDKPLPCGRHTCQVTCHPGACLDSTAVCRQPCKIPRHDCKHPCNAPCHEAPCPTTTCRFKVNMVCECGHRRKAVICGESATYRALNTAQLAHKLSVLQTAEGSVSVDLSDLMTGGPAAGGSSAASAASSGTSNAAAGAKNGKTNVGLPCNAECSQLARNRLLATALQIRNPELSSRVSGLAGGATSYPQSMLDQAKRHRTLALDVHQQLTQLVQLAQQSKQKSRCHAFSAMNREKRQFVHEYCASFGCESESQDDEPRRNVVATAYRDRSWLPPLSVLEQAEPGPRRIAPPGPRRVPGTVVDSAPPIRPVERTSVNGSESKKEEFIDYFDFTEE